MAKYDVKDIFFLDTTIDLSASFDAGQLFTKAMDISSFVSTPGIGKAKGIGLAVYRVQFTRSDTSGNRPLPAAETSAFRVGVVAGYGETQEIATNLSQDYLSSANDLLIAGIDYYSPSSLGADKTVPSGVGIPFCSPSPDVPYIVVRDSIGVLCLNSIDSTSTQSVGVRLSCAMIKLDMATLNQLLRTQTV